MLRTCHPLCHEPAYFYTKFHCSKIPLKDFWSGFFKSSSSRSWLSSIVSSSPPPPHAASTVSSNFQTAGLLFNFNEALEPTLKLYDLEELTSAYLQFTVGCRPLPLQVTLISTLIICVACCIVALCIDGL